MKNKNVQFINLGKIAYQEAYEYQNGLFQKSVDQKLKNRKLEITSRTITNNYLIFCQHPPVITLGKSGKEEHLLSSNAQLKKDAISYYKTNRGGDVTFHGPGQLVGYPILDLDHFFTDIHKYIRYLEEVVIQTLTHFAIDGHREQGLTGVWIGDDKNNNLRKICAIGVRASRWITMHGFALNINTDLSYFNRIVPCGIENKAVTSLQNELQKEINFEEVETLLKNSFQKVFEITYY